MEKIMAFCASLARRGIVCLLLCALVATSGCTTTLGYVPGHLKPTDKNNYTPTYTEVKKWGYDVVDGYDSRATLNRQSIYFGALLAAAGATAITGLAAFERGSSWLIGIPIGTAFLGSVAAIYSSAEKAHIYRLGSAYVKDLISKSDKRLIKRTLLRETADVELAIEEATKGRDEAKTKYETAITIEKQLRAKAVSDRAKTEAPNLTPADREVLEKVAVSAESLAKGEVATVESAKADLEAAETRLRYLNELKRNVQIVTEARENLKSIETSGSNSTAKDESIQKARRVLVAAEKAVDPEALEALCLRDDINNVMRRVEKHKEMLDPKNIAERLRLVGEKDSKSKEGNTGARGALDDLSDLETPVKSSCDTAI